jgi:hypothetical protein
MVTPVLGQPHLLAVFQPPHDRPNIVQAIFVMGAVGFFCHDAPEVVVIQLLRQFLHHLRPHRLTKIRNG